VPADDREHASEAAGGDRGDRRPPGVVGLDQQRRRGAAGAFEDLGEPVAAPP
jgi:hypothetical protein